MNTPDPAVVVAALVLAFVVRSIVDIVKEAAGDYLPDRLVLPLALVCGLMVGYASQLDLFAVWIPDAEVLSRLLTGAAIGSGSSFIHDLLSIGGRATTQGGQT